MKKLKFPLTATAVAGMILMYACSEPRATGEQAPEKPGDVTLLSDADKVARGKYLVEGFGCADCHSPKKMTDRGPVPDMDRWLSGHTAGTVLPPGGTDALKSGWVLFTPDLTAYVGPWGTSFSANLTPDTLTGIGTWTEEIFLRAFKGGKFHGLPAGRDLLPPMPVAMFKNLTDEDATSIFAYLKSIPPVSNAVPAPLPPAAL